MSGDFVWRMEQVLDLYAEPDDPLRPVVCFDEASKELRADVRRLSPPRPGRARRRDYEYRRAGTANLFLACCPKRGWRAVRVTKHRRADDFARALRELADVHFPEATTIRLVLDNLNTHTPAALYQTFAADEAHRLAGRFEFHYTPKHASWLNIAEMEWSALSREVLDARIPDASELARRLRAWMRRRNRERTAVRWCFTTAKARTKLSHLYPVKLK